MLVVCLEGCHGCGKTELSEKFAKAGFIVLDEAFLDMPCAALHPQSLVMETFWVCSWFERILQHSNQIESRGLSHKSHVFIADRSPFSAVFYANRGELLAPIIRQQIIEVKEAAGIEILTVHLKVDKETLWKRIQARLKVEPGRVKYNEDKREWMEKVRAFYDEFKWDLDIDNSEEDPSKTLKSLMQRVVARICLKNRRFNTAIRQCSPKLYASSSKEIQQEEQLLLSSKKSNNLIKAAVDPKEIETFDLKKAAAFEEKPRVDKENKADGNTKVEAISTMKVSKNQTSKRLALKAELNIS